MRIFEGSSLFSLVLLAASCLQGEARRDARTARVWNFDSTHVVGLPPGWKVEATNSGAELALWVVQADGSAPSRPNVLALVDARNNRGSTYNLCWTDSVSLADITLEVRVKSGAGLEDQGGGPIWRALDADNYYIARWNPLEDNFRAYSVKDGLRTQIASADVSADPDKWHTIRVVHHGSRIQGFLDGELLLEAEESTFPGRGGVGLWTKADAETSFDDLLLGGE